VPRICHSCRELPHWMFRGTLTPVPVLTTACPRNCYSTCSMRVEVEGGRVKRIEAHPDNTATGQGVCLKGLSYAERVVSPDRLLTPLRRRPRSDSFERLSWDQAIELIAGKLERYRDESGPQSILYYAGSGTKGLLNRVGSDFWRLFGGFTTTYGDLCWPAGLEATRLTLGENKHNEPDDLANAQLIILWGKNPAETHIHQMPFIDRALDRGARLVVIDPRRTQSAERAALLLQPRPGTDGALALGLAHLLIADDLIDWPFIAEHVLGYDEFAALAAEYTPQRTAALCDVPEDQVRQLASWLGTIQPATLCAGFGMQRYTSGGGWQFANLQSQIFDAVRDPVAFYPPAKADGVRRISISTARLGRDMLAARDPALRMIWVERGNPIPQNPDTSRVIEAFRRLDFRVVVDQFLTDTAREADVVLPAKTFLEQTDVINAYWHNYIQIKQKGLEPPPEVKPESEIYALLAARLGLTQGERPDLFPVGDRQVEAWLERRLEPFPELSLKRLRQGPVQAPGSQSIAFSDRQFPTPSGRIELLSTQAAQRWGVDLLPIYSPSVEAGGDNHRGDPRNSPSVPPMMLLTPNTKNRIHSQFGNLRMIRSLDEQPTAVLHPSDAGERGIETGDRVRIFNERGAIEIAVRFDAALRPGCVVLTNGWWLTQGGAVNLTSCGRDVEVELLRAADGAL